MHNTSWVVQNSITIPVLGKYNVKNVYIFYIESKDETIRSVFEDEKKKNLTRRVL